jgi:TolA-binding protein
MRRSCVWVILLLTLTSGCVYYNTFFNARKLYDEADLERTRAHRDFSAGGPNSKYDLAIKKASKVLQRHPKSKYADDAVLLIGKAFFYTEEFARAREKFIELAGVYRASELIPEAKFYHGMCEYYMGYTERARTILDEMIQSDEAKDLRDRAHFMTARIPFEEEMYEDAVPALSNYLEAFSGSDLSSRADSMLAVAYWETGMFDSARVAFIRLAKRTDDVKLLYEASYRASESAYSAGDFVTGLSEFREMSQNDKYYDHWPLLRYEVGVGLYSIDSVDAAVEIFRELEQSDPKSEAAARSIFVLAEIYEEAGDSLGVAQALFGKVSKAWTRDPDLVSESVRRSSQIGRLRTLQGTVSGEDSTRFAESHFLMGELYMLQLESVDSAREEFRRVVDDYSESRYAPLALLNLAAMEPTDGDTLLTPRLWRVLTDRYPGSEAGIWARNRLGLAPPDEISHSDVLLYTSAELMLLEAHNPDSAMVLYDLLIELFPTSSFLAQTHYARAWVLDEYFPTEDSTVYHAYQNVITAFPNTPYAVAANLKLHPISRVARELTATVQDSSVDTLYQDTSAHDATIESLADTLIYAPPWIFIPDFDYPLIAGLTWHEDQQMEVTFLIRINSLGEVEPSIELRGTSGYKEIDDQAKLIMLQVRFDPLLLDIFSTTQRVQYYFRMIINHAASSFGNYERPVNPTDSL